MVGWSREVVYVSAEMFCESAWFAAMVKIASRFWRPRIMGGMEIVYSEGILRRLLVEEVFGWGLCEVGSGEWEVAVSVSWWTDVLGNRFLGDGALIVRFCFPSNLFGKLSAPSYGR